MGEGALGLQCLVELGRYGDLEGLPFEFIERQEPPGSDMRVFRNPEKAWQWVICSA